MPRILIVDDDLAMAQMLQLLLQHSGLECLVANSGQDALRVLSQSTPDGIVLDLMMPDIDGLTVLQRLRAQAANRETPVLILTARTDEAARTACLRAGATDLLTKPVQREELVARLTRAITRPE